MENYSFNGGLFCHFGVCSIDIGIFDGVIQSSLHGISVFIVELSNNLWVRNHVLPVYPFFDVHFPVLIEDEFYDFEDNYKIKEQSDKIKNVPVVLKWVIWIRLTDIVLIIFSIDYFIYALVDRTDLLPVRTTDNSSLGSQTMASDKKFTNIFTQYVFQSHSTW